MTNPFAVSAQPTPAASNPFLSNLNAKAGSSNPFGAPSVNGSTGTTQAKPKNPFASAESDQEPKRKGRGFREQSQGSESEDSKRKHRNDSNSKKNGHTKQQTNGHSAPKKPSGFGVVDNATNAPRPSMFFAAKSSTNSFGELKESPGPLQLNTNDPHARKVYTQLHKDGISPPNWPSQPGDPKNKAAMAKFRERYEEYRDKVRASLTKAGLIDDPNKRRKLDDAIDFRGICEDMCPEYEKITRITEFDVVQAEKDPESGIAVTQKMVKKLARSAAGQEAPLPMDVRSVATLRRTLDYLIDDLLETDENLASIHGFLWDRTRAIRRDFTFFSSLTPEELKTQVYVLENIARFHVTSLHLLSQGDSTPEDFVEQQEMEQLGKSLLTLRDLYDDCNVQGIVCDNEPEFRAYYLLFHAQDPNIIEVLQRQWKPQLWKDSDEVRTAVSLVEALQNTKDFHGPLRPAPSLAAAGPLHSYFRILEDSSISYTMACFAECHFAALRRSILIALASALARPKAETKDVTANDLNEYLRFDTVDEAIRFANIHDLDFEMPDGNQEDLGQHRLLLRPRQTLAMPRLQHQSSMGIVEKKRGDRSLPDVIHTTVFEDGSAPRTTKGGIATEESLFVPDTAPQRTPSFGGSSAQLQNPFATQAGGKPSSGFAAPVAAPQSGSTSQFNFPNPAATSGSESDAAPAPLASFASPAFKPQANPNPFGVPQQQSSSAPSVFGGKSVSAEKAETQSTNPFASFSSGSTANAKPNSTTSVFGGQTPSAPEPQDTTPVSPPKKTPFFSMPPATTTTQSESPAPQEVVASTAGGSSQPTPTLSGLQPAADNKSSQPASSFFPQSTSQSSVAKPASTLNFSLQPPAKSSTINPSPLRFSMNASPTPPSTTPQPESVLASAAPITGAASSALATTKPVLPPALPLPPRDFMGDFTRWFVLGDNGLLEDFTVYKVEDLLGNLYMDWKAKREEEQRRKEEDEANAKADEWRVYNLGLKFFYRWKRNAREKRQRFLRRSGRDQMRQFHEERRKAARELKQALAEKAIEEETQLAKIDRPAELRAMLKRRKISSSQAADELLASGVLSDLPNEREAIARIVYSGSELHQSEDDADSMPDLYRTGRERLSPRQISQAFRIQSTGSPDPETSSVSTTTSTKLARKEGSKTRALREQLLGKPGLRKSLPPMPSRRSASPAPPKSTSRVSERWKLKAMGFVQMPDGSVLHESLADEIIHRGKRYPGLWSGTSPSPSRDGSPLRNSVDSSVGNPRLRASSYSTPSLSKPVTRPALGEGGRQSSATDESAPAKRKRPAGEEGNLEEEGSGEAPPHKRTVSDLLDMASKLRSQHQEIRALLDDMHDDDVDYYRVESERLESEERGMKSTMPRLDGIRDRRSGEMV